MIMLSARFFRLVLILMPFLVVLAAPRVASSQTETVQIRIHTQDLSAPTTLEENVMNAFRMSFGSRGVELGSSPSVLHVSVRIITAPGGTEMGLLSIAEAQKLGKRMVDAGAEHEIWYAGRNVTSFTPEAREVRQYMTREMLEGVSSIYAMHTSAFTPGDVSRAVEAYVADYWTRHTLKP